MQKVNTTKEDKVWQVLRQTHSTLESENLLTKEESDRLITLFVGFVNSMNVEIGSN